MKKGLVFFLKILIIIGVYFTSKWIFQKNEITSIENFENLILDNGQFFHSSFTSPSQNDIPFCVYLPPNWKSTDTISYPLLIYLYGQNGDEFTFANNIAAKQINKWINKNEVKPFILISFLGNPTKKNIQWFSTKNEVLLTSNAPGELRDFCQKNFRAGMSDREISLEGHSRGATGVLYYAFKHTNRFSSFLANAYVSDYTLDDLKKIIKKNKHRINENKLKLKMEIGTEDLFLRKYNRNGSELIHEFLNSQNIFHEYEILEGVDHWYQDIWNFKKPEMNSINGKLHLQYHLKTQK